jgi:hypothetical protein
MKENTRNNVEYEFESVWFNDFFPSCLKVSVFSKILKFHSLFVSYSYLWSRKYHHWTLLRFVLEWLYPSHMKLSFTSLSSQTQFCVIYWNIQYVDDSNELNCLIWCWFQVIWFILSQFHSSRIGNRTIMIISLNFTFNLHQNICVIWNDKLLMNMMDFQGWNSL